MDRSTFESSEPILDEMAANLDEFLDSDQFSAVRNALARLSEAIGPRLFRELERVRRGLRCGANQPSPSPQHGAIDFKG